MMTNRILDIMNARYAYLESTIRSLENKRESCPEGTINIRPNPSGFSYIWHIETTHKYLNRNNTELIRRLVQKDLINSAIKKARNEAQVLQSIIAKYPCDVLEDLYDNLPESRKKYASPLILNNEQYAQYWLSIPYKPKPFREGDPEFYTQKGERVRSKSEVIIADRLYAKGIPYKYECPLKVGKKIIHPDLTILRLSDRKILYHEHCGRMGNTSYAEDMICRINDYGKAGIYCGDRLFLTFESADQPFDLSWLDDFIEKNFR